jgi:selenocysteine-specific translation elongation factor
MSASAGHRVGVNIPEIDSSLITRGDYLCTPKSISSSSSLYVHVQVNPIYRGRITKNMVLSVALGMPAATGQIIPFQQESGFRVVVDLVEEREFDAALVLQRSVAIDIHAKVLLLRTDLPPTPSPKYQMLFGSTEGRHARALFRGLEKRMFL